MTDRNGRAVTTLSAREFEQDTDRAKKAARNGPVYIATRGRPTGRSLPERLCLVAPT